MIRIRLCQYFVNDNPETELEQKHRVRFMEAFIEMPYPPAIGTIITSSREDIEVKNFHWNAELRQYELWLPDQHFKSAGWMREEIEEMTSSDPSMKDIFWTEKDSD